MPDYGAFRFTRVAGPTPDAPDVYSPLQEGWVSPRTPPEHGAAGLDAARRCEAGSPTPKPRPMASRSAPNLRRTIRRCWCWTANSRRNPSTPMFLEPECGLAWYDAAARTSNSCSACSRRTRPRNSIAFLLGKARAAFKPARINAQFAYVGGGFGGRDHTPFPLYVALAAMFFPGRPVRLAHDRYQQFQAGIKRHAFKMHTRIGVDRATGKICRIRRRPCAGWRRPREFFRHTWRRSAPTAAIGIYDVPKVDVTTVALHSRGVTAGSMRGYGTLQTMTALEVLVDEVCSALPLDPIEFRRRNALKPGGRTMAGNPYIVSVRTPEILDKLEKHPIWQQRAEEKARGRKRGFSSAPALLAPPRITAPARTARSARWKSTRTAGSPSIAITSRWATASALRSPIGSRPIWAASPTKSRSRRSTRSVRSRSSPPATPTRWTRRRRTPQSAIRAGCRRSVRPPAPRSAPMSARMRRPRPRASCSASDCGRRRSSCGASRRPIRGPSNGRRRAGKTGS